MGYYTKYSLDVYHQSDLENEIVKDSHEEAIGEISNYRSACFDEKITWYQHEADMLEYSKKYPELIFMLSGVGEEARDLWVKYFQNGKMQEVKPKITFEVFDPNNLK